VCELQPYEQAIEREHRRAEITALREALEALPGLAEELGTDQEVAEQLRAEYERRLQILSANERDEPADDGALSRERQHVDLRVALLRRKHEAIVRLWERDEIDDSVLHHEAVPKRGKRTNAVKLSNVDAAGPRALCWFN